MRLGLHLAAFRVEFARAASISWPGHRNRLISVTKSEYRKLHIILE